jgi:hypothetical protein
VAAKYRGKVLFAFVYCQETHPMGEGASHWWSGLPFYGGLPVLSRTRNVEERATRAALFRQRAKVSEWILVDEDNDRSVHRLYGAPGNINALLVVDLKGRVVVKER